MNCHAENSILIQTLINYVPRMDIPQLIDNVQQNCHISDARHAGNYTLCVYLLTASCPKSYTSNPNSVTMPGRIIYNDSK